MDVAEPIATDPVPVDIIFPLLAKPKAVDPYPVAVISEVPDVEPRAYDPSPDAVIFPNCPGPTGT